MKKFVVNDRVEVMQEPGGTWESARYHKPVGGLSREGYHWVYLGEDGSNGKKLVPARRVRRVLVK